MVTHHTLGPGGLRRRLGLLGARRRCGGQVSGNRSGSEELGEFARHVFLSPALWMVRDSGRLTAQLTGSVAFPSDVGRVGASFGSEA